MINYDEAYANVLRYTFDFGIETVALLESHGRILAEEVLADRDFPPFDRATKDGIAIDSKALERGLERFKIEGLASAGMARQQLHDLHHCIEVMTGAIVPENTDTVIMYEHVSVADGYATLLQEARKGQDIHVQGSDVVLGTVLLPKNTRIGPGEIGILASVGKSEVQVRKMPKVCVVSTGNELVAVTETPLPHQIRRSNALSLCAALQKEKIEAVSVHIKDNKASIEKELDHILKAYDVVLLSGGVSKGKFDFIPEVMESLAVQKVFHRVAQKPGKPFWFGIQPELKTVVFSFPGNPVSTFANYHVYFIPWLYRSMSIEVPMTEVVFDGTLQVHPPLTRFVQVSTENKKGVLWASPIRENGSGDLTSLALSDGFVCLAPREKAYETGEVVLFIPA